MQERGIWKRALNILGTIAKLIELHPLWSLVVTGGFSWLAAAQAESLAFLGDIRTKTAIGVFLVILWTYVGLRVLANMNALHRTRAEPDYRYCISAEGYALAIDPEGTDMALSVWFNFRNASMWPVGLKIEKFDMRVDDRISANPDKPIEMILPRASTRVIRSGAFKKDVLKADKTSGTLSVTIAYGPPNEPPTRRYTFDAKLQFGFKRNEKGELQSGAVVEESFRDVESDI